MAVIRCYLLWTAVALGESLLFSQLPVRTVRVHEVAATSGVRPEPRHSKALQLLSENIGRKANMGEDGGSV